jgi:hypothetical protein
MGETIKVRSSLVEPIYAQTALNQPIDLGQLAIDYDTDGTMHHDTARATMSFLPKIRLEFVCPLRNTAEEIQWRFFGDIPRTKRLTLTESGEVVEVYCTAVGESHGGVVFHPRHLPITVMTPSTVISTAKVHLFNVPDFFGPENYILITGEPPLEGGRTCGRTVLRADGWSIAIVATDQTEGLIKSLKAEGGYAMTHVALIQRENGSPFSSEQLEDLIGCLHYFLSFAFGRWTGIALPTGFDANGNKVFEQWGIGNAADGAWRGDLSWFDQLHAELLPQVFPGFRSLWTNETWRQPLCSALYWYFSASGRGIDAGLILAQTALELLAWTHCIQDRKMVSPVAFKKRGLSAANKFRLLFSSLGVPREIPLTLSALHGRPGKKWEDGPEAVTDFRNSIVHADVHRPISTESLYEAWSLSLWYIDMTLLRLCGHSGQYANRLSERYTGTVEDVPWATE